ncbi:MAG: sulfite reductase subunit beta (hemoprotein), partial [Fibrobacter sp.]|nr:sulfite reductase subunit beta (hemoprotein) [Fibrobacter sp.]
CAAGIITPKQLHVAAETAKRYGSGRLHVTTRQELQIHDLPLENLIPVLWDLYRVGLSTRGGGGNTVRNITASWDSGISVNEVFDVTPHAVELTSRLIELPASWLLPRKFKIAFSNSDADNAYASVNDLGFIAKIENGIRGFKVFVAGGMGRSPQPGKLLHDFIEEKDVFIVAEAVKRVFSKYGNRKNKHTARLRHLWNTLGSEQFIELYERERISLVSEEPRTLIPEFRLAESGDNKNIPEKAQDSSEFLKWQKRYCTEQVQPERWGVKIPLLLGDITASEAIQIAETLEEYGDDVIRFTQDQKIVLRNIPGNSLNKIYELSRSVSPLCNTAPVLGNAVACAGASTCQLGICLSRGALSAAIEELNRSSLDLDKLRNFRIHFSGCSNSCGQHGIAHIGFYGKVARKDGHPYPVYTIVAGAHIDSLQGSILAIPVSEIPARAVPGFLVEFLNEYINRISDFTSYHEYLSIEGIKTIKTICNKLQGVPSFGDDPGWYRDWGSDTVFSLEGRGTGECATSLFDLIEIDLSKARELRKSLSDELDRKKVEHLLKDILFFSARALLITQTGEAVPDSEVPELFTRYFIQTGLVSANYSEIINLLKNSSDGMYFSNEARILAFSDIIGSLYSSLDESLKFHVSVQKESQSKPVPDVDLEKDLRGIACPMNFVKTKMALSLIKPGQVLKVLLDNGAPVENVPASARAEGHEIISKEPTGDYWSVLIKKGA